MPHADFVHLRVHSAYSLSQGAIRVAEIAALAQSAAMPAVAITDNGNLFGALEFSQYCTAKGVQPIVGCQIAVARTSTTLVPPPPTRVVLLAQDAGRTSPTSSACRRSGFLDTDPTLKTRASRSTRCAPRMPTGLLLLTGGTTRSDWPPARRGPEGRSPNGCSMQCTQAFPGRAIQSRLHRHGLADAEAAIEPGLISAGGCEFRSCRWWPPTTATSPPSRHARGARCPAVHRARAAPCPSSDRLSRHAGALVQARRRYACLVCRPAGGLRQYPGHRPPLRGHGGNPQARCCPFAQKSAPGQHRGRNASAPWPIEGLQRRMDRHAGADVDTAARQIYRVAPATTSSSVIASMGFSGYFHDRRRLHSVVQERRDIPVGPGRGSGAGSRRRLGADHHRSSIRCGSIYCSSGSSTPNACRCPTSISTSARTGRDERHRLRPQ